MPLITMKDIESLSPIFKGEKGNKTAKRLLRLMGIDRLAKHYEKFEHLSGPDFVAAYLKDVGVEYQVEGIENLLSLTDGPFITVSNHPYGALDGLILLDLVGHARSDFKVMANKFLSMVKTIKDSFISVVPLTDDSKGVSVDSIRGVRSAISQLNDGHPLGLFPAGAVSNFHWNDFRIYDREWQASALRLIQKMKVPVLPIRFFDRNSTFFYFLGMFGWKVRSMRLPKEILNKAGREIRVGIGPVISVEEQQECANWKDLGIKLREAVYGMDKKM
ncbi:MAG: 1-acyl-sn-glycerol-3-phosphate acyltransferase [Bacteroidales bacterium]|nr:1-acyl-sn-glycerol-3-phosphate acyltransferase [Bacteroidales bacterium]